MTDIKKLADSFFCAEEHCFAAGAVVVLAASHLDGLHWEITSKRASRKRGITTVLYTLRLLRPVQRAALSFTSLRPGTNLVATQQPPQRALSFPLTVVSVDIVVDIPTSACQVELTAVTCWVGGSFHAPLPEAHTDKPSIFIRTLNPYFKTTHP